MCKHGTDTGRIRKGKRVWVLTVRLAASEVGCFLQTAAAPGTTTKAKPEEGDRSAEDATAAPGTATRDEGSKSQLRRRGSIDARTPKQKDDSKVLPLP